MQVSDLPAKDLVPGDIVQLFTGDKVPADTRLVALKTAILRAEQASLTGEAVPVSKTPAMVVPEDIELQVNTSARAALADVPVRGVHSAN